MDRTKQRSGVANDGLHNAVEHDGDLFENSSGAASHDGEESFVNEYAAASQVREFGRSPRPIEGPQSSRPSSRSNPDERKEVSTTEPLATENQDQRADPETEQVDNKRPQLFAEYNVRQSITGMRWPDGGPPQDGRIYCPVCQGFKPEITGTIKTSVADTNCLSVTGMCTDCHNMLQAEVPPDEVPEIFASAINIPGHSSDVSDGGVFGESWRNGTSIPPETNNGNLRWLYDYRVFLESNREFDPRTVDEHQRALATMSAFLGHKPFEQISIADACRFKDELRRRRALEGDMALSWSTLGHNLDRCGAFFRWFQRRPGIEMDPDLPGYFKLSRRGRTAESGMVKGTSLTFDQALCLFAAMPGSTPIELRNRAIIAMFITTGIRVSALITLRGKH